MDLATPGLSESFSQRQILPTLERGHLPLQRPLFVFGHSSQLSQIPSYWGRTLLIAKNNVLVHVVASQHVGIRTGRITESMIRRVNDDEGTRIPPQLGRFLRRRVPHLRSRAAPRSTSACAPRKSGAWSIGLLASIFGT